VQLPHGRKLFRSNVVKSWSLAQDDPAIELSDRDASELPKDKHEDLAVEELQPTQAEIKGMYGDSDRVFVVENSREFQESRHSEFRGLESQDMFRIVARSSVTQGTRIYGTRWVDTRKTVDGKEVPKSRLVATNYCSNTKTEIGIRASTRAARLYDRER
jgi:hypothetical protein